jgi:hypothetical protein
MTFFISRAYLTVVLSRESIIAGLFTTFLIPIG